MNSIADMWVADRSRLIGLAGAGIALGAILLKIGYFFGPGVDDVLGGLAHHAFVLGLLLLLTAGSRTVSLTTLGIFWLLGVWSVYLLAYLFEREFAGLLGVGVDSEFAGTWLAPFVEETLKLAPVAVFLLLAGQNGYRHPSMSDGLLLGFMVGAGVSFQEDAHVQEILVSGDGWGAATPWTAVFPTISPLNDAFALNHALWGALSGLSFGAAMMLRHWRWTWPIALIGPIFAFSNHAMMNHYTFNYFGVQALLNRGREDPWLYQLALDLTAGGRVAMLATIAGAVAVVVAETLILRWVGKRDSMFPSLSLGFVLSLVPGSTSKTGIAQVLTADRYVRLRRSVYFAGWRARQADEVPLVRPTDYEHLRSLAALLNALPVSVSPAPAPIQPVGSPAAPVP